MLLWERKEDERNLDDIKKGKRKKNNTHVAQVLILRKTTARGFDFKVER
jgi:hypothetical protein